jgi:virginiamycin B lyase
MVRFDPETQSFQSFTHDKSGANVRQILGRKREVWAPRSGTDQIVVYRTK